MYWYAALSIYLLIDLLIDWSIDCLSYWLIDRLIGDKKRFWIEQGIWGG